MAVELIALAAGAAFLFALLMAAVMKERTDYLKSSMGEVSKLVYENKLTEARGKFEVTAAKEGIHRGAISGNLPGSFLNEMGGYAKQTGLFDAMAKNDEIPQGVSPSTYVKEAVHNVIRNQLLKRVSPKDWEPAWTNLLSAGGDRKETFKVVAFYIGQKEAKQTSDRVAADLDSYTNKKSWGQGERTETPRERQERLKQQTYNKRKEIITT